MLQCICHFVWATSFSTCSTWHMHCGDWSLRVKWSWMLMMSLPITALPTHKHAFFSISAHAAWQLWFHATNVLLALLVLIMHNLQKFFLTYALSKLIIHIANHCKNWYSKLSPAWSVICNICGHRYMRRVKGLFMTSLNFWFCSHKNAALYGSSPDHCFQSHRWPHQWPVNENSWILLCKNFRWMPSSVNIVQQGTMPHLFSTTKVQTLDQRCPA